MTVCVIANTDSMHTKTWLKAMSERLPEHEFLVVSRSSSLPELPNVKMALVEKNTRIIKKKLPKADLYHLHHVNSRHARIGGFLPKPYIVTMWGTDLHHGRDPLYKIQKPVYEGAELITFSNPQVRDTFVNRYGMMGKTRIAGFPSEIIESIRSFAYELIDTPTLREMKRVSKEQHGLPQDKLIVVIGYSGRPAHRHVQVLEQLKGIEGILKVLQAGRGIRSPYLAKLKEAEDGNTLILTKYYEPYEMATFRLACDIMINVQPHDLFSLAMKEHLMVRNVVINGSWLPYEIIDQRGFHIKVDKLEELNPLIREVRDNYQSILGRTDVNVRLIESLCAKEGIMAEWEDIYRRAYEAN